MVNVKSPGSMDSGLRPHYTSVALAKSVAKSIFYVLTVRLLVSNLTKFGGRNSPINSVHAEVKAIKCIVFVLRSVVLHHLHPSVPWFCLNEDS